MAKEQLLPLILLEHPREGRKGRMGGKTEGGRKKRRDGEGRGEGSIIRIETQ